MSRINGIVNRGRKKTGIGWANLKRGLHSMMVGPAEELIEFHELDSILNRSGISDDYQTILLLKTVIFNLPLNNIGDHFSKNTTG
ncbi:hypothetical protein DFO52_105180 [Enterobacter sp. AG326]|nr:hypothetical protein DFO52_105180 [Enterobacter sp. AG326]